ncbi:MAG TPA: peptidase S41, partial [Anaeromyxobacteraceae bacterium]
MTPLFLSLLLAVVSPNAARAAQPSAAAPAPPDPCDRLSSLDDAPACGDQPLCSARQRVQLVCELRDAIEKRYVFYPVKGRMLGAAGRGFDSRRHLDACVEQERALAREDDPLRFYDRMRRCTAAFADGHLLLG